MPTTTYRASAFLAAAAKLRIEAVVGSDRRQALEALAPGRTLTVDFHNLQAARQSIIDFAQKVPIQSIIPVDEDTAVLAAVAAQALNLPHNSVDSALASKEKHRLREILSKTELLSPSFQLIAVAENPREFAEALPYPCVVKPDFLSASRGVIRVDDGQQFIEAFGRIKKILLEPEVQKKGGELAQHVLVESYIPGREVALEGILTDGSLKVLAIFDKPDPLVGPYFEETIYVTPSRLSPEEQDNVARTVSQAAAAVGIQHGAVHAELRLNAQGAWIIEIAARSIGGLCSRALRFRPDLTLEEVILKHAIGLNISSIQREESASGVMMIPMPGAGILKEVRNIASARQVNGVEDIRITVPLGQTVVPLPEGHRYLGFIFAKNETPQLVEEAISEAHRKLEFVIAAQPGELALREGE